MTKLYTFGRQQRCHVAADNEEQARALLAMHPAWIAAGDDPELIEWTMATGPHIGEAPTDECEYCDGCGHTDPPDYSPCPRCEGPQMPPRLSDLYPGAMPPPERVTSAPARVRFGDVEIDAAHINPRSMSYDEYRATVAEPHEDDTEGAA